MIFSIFQKHYLNRTMEKTTDPQFFDFHNHPF